MDFLKKNYEKVLLGAVLLGLAVAVAFLPFKISSEKQALADVTANVTHPRVRPLTNLDLAISDAAVQRAAMPVAVDFSTPHRLFSPLPWQKASDGRLIPLDETHVGPRAVQVSDVTPLHLVITLDNVQVVEGSHKYVIGVERQAAPKPVDRRKRQSYSSVGEKNPAFTLKEVQGPPEDPTSVVLELADGTMANINKNQPFSRVEGYTATLKYDPERKTWRDQRVGASISFNGEDYNIVAINENEVVLSAKSNQKKWTIKTSPTATPERR
jgi:hypothetical protein